MISIEKALLLDRRMRALTGLDGPGFVQLEKRFTRVLADEVAAHTRAGQPRQRAAGAGPKGALPGTRRQLFFMLFYLKAYPAQDVMGYLFGLSQPQVCARVCTPHKKPRGRPLHWRHRRANRELARERVPVEHALASVKRLGILRQPLRSRRKTTADEVMLIGCALHNYRLDQKAAPQN